MPAPRAAGGAACARLALLRAGRRSDRGAARRRPQGEAEDHRPHGRCACRALSAVRRAQALRRRRAPKPKTSSSWTIARRTASTASTRRCSACLRNFPVTLGGLADAPLVFPFGVRRRPASDKEGKEIVRAALEPGAFRDRLTRDIFVSDDPSRPGGIARIHACQGGGVRGGRPQARARDPQGRGEALPRQ